MTSERCLRCDWWDHGVKKCDRIFKATIRVAEDGGEIRLETQPGLLPKGMEAEFSAWLVGALGDYIDAWPGWGEVKRLRDKANGRCIAEKESVCIKEYGKKLELVRPVKEEGDNLPGYVKVNLGINPW